MPSGRKVSHFNLEPKSRLSSRSGLGQNSEGQFVSFSEPDIRCAT
jgi:hypothetical protein